MLTTIMVIVSMVVDIGLGGKAIRDVKELRKEVHDAISEIKSSLAKE